MAIRILIYFVFLFATLSISNIYCKAQTFEKQNNIQEKNSKFSNKETIIAVEDSSILKRLKDRSFYYHDSLYRGTPFFINKLITKLFLNRPTLICQADKNQTLYLIYPGEHIELRLNKNNEILFLIHGNRQRNNELNFFKEIINRTGRIYNSMPIQYYHAKVRSIESLTGLGSRISEIKNLRFKFLDSCGKANLIGLAFTQLAENIIQCAAFRDSLLLYWNNKELMKQNSLYEDFVKEKLKSFKIIKFQPNLVYQGASMSLISMMTTPYILYTPKNLKDFINRFDKIENEFYGILKDFLLANTIVSANQQNIIVPDEYIKKFYQECNDVTYKNTVTALLTSSNKNLRDIDRLVNAFNKTALDIRTIIHGYYGKIILIDFWASWCLPCREEFPMSKNLEKYFNRNKVAFIYISTDKNIDDWKNCIKQEDMKTNDSFLLLNADKSTFMKEFNISTIPRYMIINKKGEIVNSNAPRPSDPNLKNQIEKFLNNN